MKTSTIAACSFLLLIFGCNQKQPSKATSADTTLNQCYTSVAGKDSASLKLIEINGTVKGDLHLMFAKKDHLKGEIVGTFKGDTLFADYTYKLGNGKETFKNPAAFLRKDGKLYQGYGEIMTYVGRTYFSKDVPIDFERGFVFEPVACK